MKEFFKTPLGIIIVLIAVIAGAIAIGRSKWFANLVLRTDPKADGMPCQIVGGIGVTGLIAGKYQNGVCVAGGGPGGGVLVERVYDPIEERNAIVIPRHMPGGNPVAMTPTNARRILNLNNAIIPRVLRESNCSVAQDWCATEFGQTGNANGFYCKVWKAACLGGSN